MPFLAVIGFTLNRLWGRLCKTPNFRHSNSPLRNCRAKLERVEYGKSQSNKNPIPDILDSMFKEPDLEIAERIVEAEPDEICTPVDPRLVH